METTTSNPPVIFRMPPQDWKRIWLKSIVVFTVAVIVAIGSISLAVVPFYENPSPVWGLLALVIVGVLIMAPIFVVTSRLQVKRLDSQLYEVTDTAFIHHNKGREIRIEFNDIAEIADNPLLGIIVSAKSPQRLVIIPNGIANKAALIVHLNSVKPVQKAGLKALVLPLYILGVFLLIGFMLAPRLWISIPAVLLLAGLAVRETVSMIRIKNFSKQEKASGFIMVGFFWVFVLLGVLHMIGKHFLPSSCVCP